MSYKKHHAIIVTGFNDNIIKQAHSFATSIFGKQVSDIIPSAVNIYDTFLIGPDGSCEYNEDSEVGDQRRFEFITYLENHRFADGSNALTMIELSYDDDKFGPKIVSYIS